jgi:peptidoglycan/LPS O-acetylase OafA/YrhL
VNRATPNRSNRRIAGVEALRAVAASSIVVYHCWLYGSPGGQRADMGPLSRFVLPYLPIGVTLFFALSAFLLYRPLADSILNTRPRPSVRRYARNRALRILPAYWLVLLVTGLALGAAIVRPSPTEVALASLVQEPSLLLRNLTLAQNYFPDSVITGVAPAWSLSVEVVFYLMLPILGWVAGRIARTVESDRGRMWAALVPAVALFLLGLSGKATAIWVIEPGTGPSPGWDGDWYSVVVRSFWVQADLFAFGMGLAVVWAAVDSRKLTLPGWWRGAAVAILVPIGLSTTQFGEGQVLGASGWATLLAIGCTLLVALAVMGTAEGRTHGRLGRVLQTRALVAVGLVSYSLFLWNEPLVRWLADKGITLEGRRGFLLNLVVVGVLSGILAALTYRFVETPAIRLKSPPSVMQANAAGSAARQDAHAATP